MHEVSIALGMVDELKSLAHEHNAKKITAINLKIGKMSGIVTDSLKFAFDAVKAEHPFIASSEIHIREIPLVYRCYDCQNKFEAEDIYFPECLACKSYNLELVSGEEQHIENVEMEV